MDLGILDINVVFAEALFTYPLLIVGKSYFWVRFLSRVNLTNNLALNVVRSKMCHSGFFPSPFCRYSPILFLTKTTVTNAVQQTYQVSGRVTGADLALKTQRQINSISGLYSVIVH